MVAFEDGRGRPTAAAQARAVGMCFAMPTADSVAANNTKVAGRSPPRDARCLHRRQRRVYADEFGRQQLCGDGHTENIERARNDYFQAPPIRA